jgi:hypothetical protein
MENADYEIYVRLRGLRTRLQDSGVSEVIATQGSKSFLHWKTPFLCKLTGSPLKFNLAKRRISLGNNRMFQGEPLFGAVSHEREDIVACRPIAVLHSEFSKDQLDALQLVWLLSTSSAFILIHFLCDKIFASF